MKHYTLKQDGTAQERDARLAPLVNVSAKGIIAQITMEEAR